MALRTFSGTVDGDITPGSGNWDVDPIATDTAQLATGAGLINPPSTGTLTCVSLDANGETIAGGIYNCAVDSDSGSITGSATFNGALTNVSTIASDFAIGATGTATLSGVVTMGAVSTITNSGSIAFSGLSAQSATGAETLTVTGTGTLSGTIAADPLNNIMAENYDIGGVMNDLTITYNGDYSASNIASVTLRPLGTSSVSMFAAPGGYSDAVYMTLVGTAGGTCTIKKLRVVDNSSWPMNFVVDGRLGTMQVANGAEFNPTRFQGTITLLGTVTVPQIYYQGMYMNALAPDDANSKIVLKANQICNGIESTDVPAVGDVEDGVTYDRGTKEGEYPTTATTQAADAAIVTAGKANIVDGETFTFGASSSEAGTYPTTATTQAADAAIVTAGKANVADGTTFTFGASSSDAGTYPLTATTQAADAGIVTAGKANVKSGTTFTFGASSSDAGTYPTTATTQSADAATLDAVKADIKNTRTITFGAATPVVGTLDITADNDDPVTLSTGYARRA